MDFGKAVPFTAAARLQFWCSFLGDFSCHIQYRSMGLYSNCDDLPSLQRQECKADQLGETDDEAMFYSNI